MKPTEEKIQSNASDLPVYLFKQGNNCEAYRYFGAHMETRAGEAGVVFRVWAPHALSLIHILCTGYADGYPRQLSCGKGIVEIHGKACPVLGLSLIHI